MLDWGFSMFLLAFAGMVLSTFMICMCGRTTPQIVRVSVCGTRQPLVLISFGKLSVSSATQEVPYAGLSRGRRATVCLFVFCGLRDRTMEAIMLK